MTSILENTTAATPRPRQPSTRFRRRWAGGVVLGAAALSMAGFLTTPWENGSSTQSYLESLTGAPVQAIVAASILHFGYVLLVPTAFVLFRLTRRGAPRLAMTGIGFAVLGSGLSGLVVTDMYDLSIGLNVGEKAGVPISEMHGVPGVAIGMLSMAVTSALGTFLGMLLLALAAWRSRLAPFWPALAIVAGWVTAFGAHGALRACGGWAAVAVALAFLGVRVLQLSDAEYDAR
ncbi:MAG: hypothetical protein ACXVXD_13675 [Nocardioidaceae bacterium]